MENIGINKVYLVEDVMECLGIGKSKAYELFRSASFPSTKLGRTYFITAANFEKWLERYAGKEFIL